MPITVAATATRTPVMAIHMLAMAVAAAAAASMVPTLKFTARGMGLTMPWEKRHGVPRWIS